jgi:hypothetical protein
MIHSKNWHIKVFFIWLLPFTIYGQRTVSGRVTDAEDNKPIVGASVFIANTTVGTTTDSTGNYNLKIQETGSFTLAVSFVGYQPVFKDIEPGNTSVIFDIAMKTFELDEVVVSKKSQGSSKRRQTFLGDGIGKDAIKKNASCRQL